MGTITIFPKVLDKKTSCPINKRPMNYQTPWKLSSIERSFVADSESKTRVTGTTLCRDSLAILEGLDTGMAVPI